ncbi:MAG TPA: hypothetical protein VGT61_07405 [Thermomicrobiales bacterium]|jgi:hypothetical protein|nr:hypothetical protein [Thermomicrobiales bacterium]
MHRSSTFVLAAILLLGMTLVVGRPFATAQDSGDDLPPAVGSWNVESDPGDAEYSPRLITLAADGTALFVSGRQTVGVGAWSSTSDATVAASFAVTTDGPSYILIRAQLEVAADGESFTGTYTIEAIFDPAGGGTSGEIGPGTLTGARFAAEAPGTPIASFEEFFPSPDGSPEATPAS